MNTQEMTTEMMPQTTGCESSNDTFAQSLLLWIASFPVFAIGLSMLSGTLHTIGYVMVCTAIVCFLSPVAQLLCCMTEKQRG